jgi:hypothetical protein
VPGLLADPERFIHDPVGQCGLDAFGLRAEQRHLAEGTVEQPID